MKSERPPFRESDTVMICKHLFERARQGRQIAWGSVKWQGRFDPKLGFTREDGTTGSQDFLVACLDCAKLPPGEVDYVEEFFRNGQLHVADFCKSASV